MKRLMSREAGLPMYGPMYRFHPQFGSNFNVINGQSCIPFYNNEFIDKQKSEAIIASNDVVICSFFKTGTHWIKKILLEIMRHHPKTKNSERFQSLNISFAIPNIDAFEIPPKDDNLPRLMHSHFHSEDFTQIQSIDDNAKLIYITRNPKDVAVSFHSMNLGLKDSIDFTGDMDTTIEQVLIGITQCGDYWDHVSGWKRVYDSNKYNMKWLYYEDILDAPMDTIKTLVKHVGLDDGKLEEKDYDSICERILFDNVKREYRENTGNLYEVLGLGADEFFRSGKNGDWKKYFSEKMSHYYDCKTLVKFHQTPDIKYYKEAFESVPCEAI